MLKILKLLKTFFVEFDEKYYDVRSQNFFLVSTPWPTFIICFAYLYFIKVLGPAWMKNRQPYTLKYPMMIYNVIQVMANTLLTYKCLFVFFNYMNISEWRCLEADRSYSERALHIVQCAYYYYLLKILDLMDTVFFVLRKSFNQISFLHVYHHFGMLLGVYFTMRYGINGQTSIAGFLNCIVHTIMYFYYFMSSIRSEMKNSLWWKKYITQVQMIQFAVNIIHFTVAIFNQNCSEPKYLMLLFMLQDFFVFTMFGDFYIKAYVKKHNSK